jgi:hypothetical protein
MNWRLHPEAQTTALDGAIDEVSWAGAALYNERTGRLIDGHARKGVRSDLLVDGKMPVLVGSWTEEQEKLILATLDPLAGLAEVDSKMLESLHQDIEIDNTAVQEMLKGQATEHGFGIDEEPEEAPEAQVDRAEELREKWGVEAGQLWVIPSNWYKCPGCGKLHRRPDE